MPAISLDAGVERARLRLGLDSMIPAQAWRVQRIDHPDQAYYLIVFGDGHSDMGVAAVDLESGEVTISAVLEGTQPQLTVDADKALEKAGLRGAQAELVWRPCRISLSPLQPFWQVRSEMQTLYVDQQGVVWKSLEPAGPGG
jgi:hypothetical protein